MGGWQIWIAWDQASNVFVELGDPPVDDGAYLRSLILEIGRQFRVDPKRVYAEGHSGGASMVLWMACSSPDLIAGIASLEGPFYSEAHTYCAPSQPVDILIIHGTRDETVRYWGGVPPVLGPVNGSPYPSAMRVAGMWAGHNGAEDPVTDPVPTMNLDSSQSGLDTVVTRYTNHPPGGAVELWTINGGAHSPSLSSEFSPRLIDWFLAHPKP